jgi:hypothetical protein
MYDTSFKFKHEGRNLSMYKTARQLGISVGASIQLTPLIHHGQSRLAYQPPVLTMNCTEEIFLRRAPELLSSVNPKCSHVKLIAKYHTSSLSMIFGLLFPLSSE